MDPCARQNSSERPARPPKAAPARIVAPDPPASLHPPPDTLPRLVRRSADFTAMPLPADLSFAVRETGPSTYEGAAAFPERYDRVRTRTGGWSEFFVAVFDFHQEYFRRRSYYTCDVSRPVSERGRS